MSGGRVLVVTPWYRPLRGGVATVAEALHVGLREAGEDADLLVLGDSRTIEPHPREEGVWEFLVPSYGVRSLRPRALLAQVIRAPGAVRRLARFIREREIGRVILVYPLDHAWIFLVLRRLLGIRIHPSFHGGDVRRFPDATSRSGRLFRLLVRNAESVIVCSEQLGTEVRSRVPQFRGRMVHIPNAVDARRFTPPPAGSRPPGSGPTLVHVSNFFGVKRTLDIVEAFARADLPPESRLLMVGDGEDREAAERRARELGVDDRVEFTGSRPDVRPFLHRADLFVLASESEGAPVALLEAMACGLPWVSTPWGAARDLPPGECGLVVPPNRPDELARAFEELLADPERLKRMGRRARERAETDYGRDTWIRRHLEAIGPSSP